MKVFITGATGFLGKNLVGYYKDHEVYEFHRYMDALSKLEYFKPDLIINCAAEIHANDKMWESNVQLVKDCLDYVKDNPKTQFIQIGSSSEYGPVNQPSNEQSTIQPLDMYSTTKGIATTMCQGYAKVYNLDLQIVRPYSLYGPGEKAYRLFPNLWKSFKLGTPMTMVLGVHDFCYVDDFINGLNTVVNSSKRESGEIINISNGKMITNVEVLAAFQRAAGNQGNVDIISKFVTYPFWQADTTKIKQKFEWTPKYNLDQGVEKFLEAANYE
jgi:nucleoside-diphosphate-sugar epimerase